MEFYRHTAGKFLAWLESQSVTQPQQVTARHVRAYLAELAGKSDNTKHDHARAVKTLLRFWHAEGYTPEAIGFDMPRIAKKKLPRLTADDLQAVINACNVRDRALVLFLADSGLRRAEVCALDWADIDMQTGLVKVARGKGGKARSAVIGANTRRALLKYRRTLFEKIQKESPLFQTRTGTRFTPAGLALIFRRISQRTGIHVTAHALRRTFVILSLRAGMDVLHLQAQLGHADLTMVNYYAGLEDSDLLREHKAHSPIDNLARLKNESR